MFAGAVCDHFGGWKVLLLAAALFTRSAIGCGSSHGIAKLILFRIIAGMGIGVASMLSPLYIAEMSPPRQRGRLVSLQQLAIICGILAAYFTNAPVLHTALSDAAKALDVRPGRVPGWRFFALPVRRAGKSALVAQAGTAESGPENAGAPHWRGSGRP